RQDHRRRRRRRRDRRDPRVGERNRGDPLAHRSRVPAPATLPRRYRRGHPPGRAVETRVPVSSRLPGFYRLRVAERRRRLLEAAQLPADGFAAVDPGALPLDVADGMIENVVGTYALPFAVAVNFVVDGTEVFVPMAVEEPSIVAAASNAARRARPRGFTTEVS